MTFSIIITTYNRPAKVLELVVQLLPIIKNKGNLIVIDSSDIPNSELKQKEELVYLRSLHKNQPYQRYLGYLASKNEILVFLDDDMEVVDDEFLQKLEKIFENKSITGVAIRFENKHEDSLLAEMPQSKLFKRSGLIKRVKGWLTGYPELKPGKFGFCGNRGKQPKGGGPTEWVSGGAFAARRTAMFQNFNFQLFDIFEQKLGMGEDAIIGYGLSKQGKLIYHDELFFLHNDQKDSTYTKNIHDFAQRVAFSRLYLSLEKKRLAGENIILAHLHYHWYILWRIIGYALNTLVNPTQKRQLMLVGSIKGCILSLKFKFNSSNKSNSYWENELKMNLLNQ